MRKILNIWATKCLRKQIAKSLLFSNRSSEVAKCGLWVFYEADHLSQHSISTHTLKWFIPSLFWHDRPNTMVTLEMRPTKRRLMNENVFDLTEYSFCEKKQILPTISKPHAQRLLAFCRQPMVPNTTKATIFKAWQINLNPTSYSRCRVLYTIGLPPKLQCSRQFHTGRTDVSTLGLSGTPQTSFRRPWFVPGGHARGRCELLSYARRQWMALVFYYGTRCPLTRVLFRCKVVWRLVTTRYFVKLWYSVI